MRYRVRRMDGQRVERWYGMAGGKKAKFVRLIPDVADREGGGEVLVAEVVVGAVAAVAVGTANGMLVVRPG